MTGRPDPRAIDGSPAAVRSGRPSLVMTGPQPVADDLPSPRRCADGAAAQPCQSPSFLRHLVHDLRGPARALADIPAWVAEDLQAIGATLPADCRRLLPLLAENATRLDDILVGLGDWIAAADPPSDPEPAVAPAVVLAQLARAAGCDAAVDLAAVPLAAEDLALVARAAFENAVRFNPNRVRVAVSAKIYPDGWQLSFLDDGVGPPIADATPLLAPLARARVGGAHPGAGFGLAVIDRVVARNGGSTEFGTVPGGQGAALRLRFPL